MVYQSPESQRFQAILLPCAPLLQTGFWATKNTEELPKRHSPVFADNLFALGFYPLTEPIITPFTKYFWMKG